MQLPDPFRETIARAFGERGRTWLKQLPAIVAECAARWGLTEVRTAPGLSYNYIAFAQSAAHGPVVLKVGVPHPELWTEARALAIYGGRGVCALHGWDEALGALLLERVLPGEDLSAVASPEERVAVGARVIAGLPVPVDGAGAAPGTVGGAAPGPVSGAAPGAVPVRGAGAAPGTVGSAAASRPGPFPPQAPDFPAFRDWTRKAFARARREHPGLAPLMRQVDAAEALLEEIDTPERPRVLLHGDLHHYNILRNQRGGWTVIDPKGAIGPRCLEVGRFILNEADMPNPADLDRITAAFGEALGEPRWVIAACGLIDRALSTCWSLEDREAPEAIAAKLRHGEELLACVERA